VGSGTSTFYTHTKDVTGQQIVGCSSLTLSWSLAQVDLIVQLLPTVTIVEKVTVKLGNDNR